MAYAISNETKGKYRARLPTQISSKQRLLNTDEGTPSLWTNQTQRLVHFSSNGGELHCSGGSWNKESFAVVKYGMCSMSFPIYKTETRLGVDGFLLLVHPRQHSNCCANFPRNSVGSCTNKTCLSAWTTTISTVNIS